MRRTILILLAAVFSSFQATVITSTDQHVMKAAEGQLGVFTGRIPAGEATAYGFRQEDDMDLLTVGKPYRIIEFTTSFYDDTAIGEDKNYINIKNEWRTPVDMRGEVRVMLTVKGTSGNYSVTAMGDSDLAKELHAKSRGANDSDEYYLLRVPALSADFFVHEANNSFNDAEFIPLASAAAAIPALSKSYTSAFTLADVQRIIKEELQKRAQKIPLKAAPKKKPVKKTIKKPVKKPAVPKTN